MKTGGTKWDTTTKRNARLLSILFIQFVTDCDTVVLDLDLSFVHQEVVHHESTDLTVIYV